VSAARIQLRIGADRGNVNLVYVVEVDDVTLELDTTMTPARLRAHAGILLDVAEEAEAQMPQFSAKSSLLERLLRTIRA